MIVHNTGILLLVFVLAAGVLSAVVSSDGEQGYFNPREHKLLFRHRRSPALLIPAGALLLRAGGKFIVRIGPKLVRAFKTRKQAVEFLRRPSTLKKIEKLPKDKENIVVVPSGKIAKDIAKKLTHGKKPPAHHSNPKEGNPHFHAKDKAGKLKPPHISYPKSGPKSLSKFSPGAKAKVQQKGSGSKSGGIKSGGIKSGGIKSGGIKGIGSKNSGSKSGGGGSRSGGGGSRNGGRGSRNGGGGSRNGGGGSRNGGGGSRSGGGGSRGGGRGRG